MTSELSNCGETLDSDPSGEYCVVHHRNELCDKMFELYKSGDYVDVTLVAGVDKTRLVRCGLATKVDTLNIIETILFSIEAHRIVLSAASPCFHTLLTGSMEVGKRRREQSDITIEHVNGETLRALIGFCYIGEIRITADNADELMAVASRLKIVGVVKMCEQYYMEALSRENCLGLWVLATQYDYDELKRDAYAIVMESFPRLMCADEFLNLDKDAVQKLLADDNLNVYSELDVFDALIGWVRADEDKRKAYFAELLTFIRFEQMNREVKLEGLASNSCFNGSREIVY